MTKKKEKKHPKEMTADEAMAHVLNPKAVEHIKAHIEKISGKKKRVKKVSE